MTLKELRSKAKELGLRGYSTKNKGELEAAIAIAEAEFSCKEIMFPDEIPEKGLRVLENVKKRSATGKELVFDELVRWSSVEEYILKMEPVKLLLSHLGIKAPKDATFEELAHAIYELYERVYPKNNKEEKTMTKNVNEVIVAVKGATTEDAVKAVLEGLTKAQMTEVCLALTGSELDFSINSFTKSQIAYTVSSRIVRSRKDAEYKAKPVEEKYAEITAEMRKYQRIHNISLCGDEELEWIAQQLGVTVPDTTRDTLIDAIAGELVLRQEKAEIEKLLSTSGVKAKDVRDKLLDMRYETLRHFALKSGLEIDERGYSGIRGTRYMFTVRLADVILGYYFSDAGVLSELDRCSTEELRGLWGGLEVVSDDAKNACRVELKLRVALKITQDNACDEEQTARDMVRGAFQKAGQELPDYMKDAEIEGLKAELERQTTRKGIVKVLTGASPEELHKIARGYGLYTDGMWDTTSKEWADYIMKYHDFGISEEVTAEKFREVYDELAQGSIAVGIPEIRVMLGWEREEFDQMLVSLRDTGKIQLSRADNSTMTINELRDCFVDEKDCRMGTVRWLNMGVEEAVSAVKAAGTEDDVKAILEGCTKDEICKVCRKVTGCVMPSNLEKSDMITELVSAVMEMHDEAHFHGLSIEEKVREIEGADGFCRLRMLGRCTEEELKEIARLRGFDVAKGDLSLVNSYRLKILLNHLFDTRLAVL